MYPSKWHGNTDLYGTSGVAEFDIEGVNYALHLQSFADYQTVCKMLDVAFCQGKAFAEQAMRSHIILAMDKAKQDHSLKVD